MNKLLLLTNRNIYSNCGESSLIHRRNLAILEEKKIKIDIIGFSKKNKEKSENYLATFKCYDKIKVIFFSYKNIIKNIIVLRKELKKYLKIENPKNIIISGYICSIFSFDILKSYKQKNNCKFFYDLHGCVEEFQEYLIKNKILGRILTIFYSFIEKKVLKISDSVFIVSNYMKKYLEEKYKVLGKEYYFIPCGIENCDINRLYYRKKIRNELGIDINEKVYLYSGGVSKWQMLEESLLIYKNHFKELGYKLVIFSKNTGAILEILNKVNLNLNNVIIKSVKNEELLNYLTIGDIGIMYREKKMTNKVAFPNKFSEYLKD